MHGILPRREEIRKSVAESASRANASSADDARSNFGSVIELGTSLDRRGSHLRSHSAMISKDDAANRASTASSHNL
jgi:hypothetical protein